MTHESHANGIDRRRFFAVGGVKNHELHFGHLGGKGGDPNGPIADAIKAAR